MLGTRHPMNTEHTAWEHCGSFACGAEDKQHMQQELENRKQEIVAKERSLSQAEAAAEKRWAKLTEDVSAKVRLWTTNLLWLPKQAQNLPCPLLSPSPPCLCPHTHIMHTLHSAYGTWKVQGAHNNQ